MATPHVAGVAAQILRARPTMSSDRLADVISCMGVTDAITGLPSSTSNILLRGGDAATIATNLDCAFPPSPPPNPHPPPFAPGAITPFYVNIVADSWASETSWEISVTGSPPTTLQGRLTGSPTAGTLVSTPATLPTGATFTFTLKVRHHATPAMRTRSQVVDPAGVAHTVALPTGAPPDVRPTGFLW